MISSFNPLSPQARSMSGRSARYEAPLSSFTSRGNMEPASKPAQPVSKPPAVAPVSKPPAEAPTIAPAMDVYQQMQGEPGASQNLGGYAPSDDLSRTLDDANVEGLMGDLTGLARGKLGSAALNTGLAANAGVPTAQALKGALLGAAHPLGLMQSLVPTAINRMVQRTLSENRLRGMEDPMGLSMAGVARSMLNAPEAARELDDLQTTAIADEAAKTRSGFLGSLFGEPEAFSEHQAFQDARTQAAMEQSNASPMADNPSLQGEGFTGDGFGGSAYGGGFDHGGFNQGSRDMGFGGGGIGGNSGGGVGSGGGRAGNAGTSDSSGGIGGY